MTFGIMKVSWWSVCNTWFRFCLMSHIVFTVAVESSKGSAGDNSVPKSHNYTSSSHTDGTTVSPTTIFPLYNNATRAPGRGGVGISTLPHERGSQNGRAIKTTKHSSQRHTTVPFLESIEHEETEDEYYGEDELGVDKTTANIQKVKTTSKRYTTTTESVNVNKDKTNNKQTSFWPTTEKVKTTATVTQDKTNNNEPHFPSTSRIPGPSPSRQTVTVGQTAAGGSDDGEEQEGDDADSLERDGSDEDSQGSGEAEGDESDYNQDNGEDTDSGSKGGEEVSSSDEDYSGDEGSGEFINVVTTDMGSDVASTGAPSLPLERTSEQSIWETTTHRQSKHQTTRESEHEDGSGDGEGSGDLEFLTTRLPLRETGRHRRHTTETQPYTGFTDEQSAHAVPSVSTDDGSSSDVVSSQFTTDAPELTPSDFTTDDISSGEGSGDAASTMFQDGGEFTSTVMPLTTGLPIPLTTSSFKKDSTSEIRSSMEFTTGSSKDLRSSEKYDLTTGLPSDGTSDSGAPVHNVTAEFGGDSTTVTLHAIKETTTVPPHISIKSTYDVGGLTTPEAGAAVVATTMARDGRQAAVTTDRATAAVTEGLMSSRLPEVPHTTAISEPVTDAQTLGKTTATVVAQYTTGTNIQTSQIQKQTTEIRSKGATTAASPKQVHTSPSSSSTHVTDRTEMSSLRSLPVTMTTVSASLDVTSAAMLELVVNLNFRLTKGAKWKTSLKDDTSPYYTSFSKRVRNSLRTTLEKTLAPAVLEAVEILKFTSGSVVVDSRLTLSNYGSLTAQDVFTTFKHHTQNGTMPGGFTVDSSSVKFSVVEKEFDLEELQHEVSAAATHAQKHYLPNWAIGAIIGGGVLIMFGILFTIVMLCTHSSRRQSEEDKELFRSSPGLPGYSDDDKDSSLSGRSNSDTTAVIKSDNDNDKRYSPSVSGRSCDSQEKTGKDYGSSIERVKKKRGNTIEAVVDMEKIAPTLREDNSITLSQEQMAEDKNHKNKHALLGGHNFNGKYKATRDKDADWNLLYPSPKPVSLGFPVRDSDVVNLSDMYILDSGKAGRLRPGVGSATPDTEWTSSKPDNSEMLPHNDSTTYVELETIYTDSGFLLLYPGDANTKTFYDDVMETWQTYM